MRRRWRLSLMPTTWIFLYAWKLSVGSLRVAAQSNSSSSNTYYAGCSGYTPFINDSVCDELNNNADCGYDGGDCCLCTCVDSPTKSCGYYADFNCTDPNVPDDCGETPSPAAAFGFPNCTGYIWDLGNTLCDDDLNNEECGYDGGDCCRCTCRSTSTYYDYCGYYGYDCVDPDAPTDCDTASPTPSPAAALGYPDCTGYMYDLQNGYCDWDLNNEECGYDGGDCCRCTCEDGTYTCGTYNYDCEDPTAPTDCPTPSPTPTPAAGLGFPDCTGYMYDLHNGFCDWDLNNEECGYDGGDCCSCTCEEGLPYTCGYYGFDCQDPDASSNCSTTGPTPTPAAGLGYPDCTGDMSDLQNGYCDLDLNNEDCGYDGGDCCRCTCEAGLTYTCGDYDFNCEDPTAPTDCHTSSSTPTPAAGLGYTDCTGDMSDLQNGYCDLDLNNDECGYDGGDCCSCTCVDGSYTCGYYGFRCEDPAAPTYCPTTRYPYCTADMDGFQNGNCDWQLNSEDCGYDGGDCCECSCTDNNGDHECGYNCLDPDPCPNAENSSKGKTSRSTIMIIAGLSAVCGAICILGCVKIMKMCERVMASGTTTHSATLSPPPAYSTTAGAQQRLPNRTTNNLTSQQPTVALPVGPTGPSHQVGVVNPQRTAVQNSRQPRVVIPWGTRAPPGQPRAVTGLRAYPDPAAPSAPPQQNSTDPMPRGVTTARVTAFRSAPVLESTVLEESSNTAATGRVASVHDVDAVEVERIRLAVAESRQVQTISEAIIRQEMCQPQPDASNAVVVGTVSNPSSITNAGIKETDSDNADENENGQDASKRSEWSSKVEGGVEEEEPQDDKKLGTDGDLQAGTGDEATGPIRTGNGEAVDVTNSDNVEEKNPSNADKGDNDQDASSGSEWSSDGDGEAEEESPKVYEELGDGIGRLTGTKEGGDDADGQETIMAP